MADDQVALVKSKTDIVSEIGERVDLKRAGRNFKALCPFHGEKTPSFFVSPEMQTYKCFGCGEGGDVISFLQKYEGLTFPEALRQLADKAGVKLASEYRSGKDKQKDGSLEIIHLAAEYYHYLLMEHKVGVHAKSYLRDRKVTSELIKDFMLGYAPDSWEAVQKYLVRKKGFEVREVEKVGLVIGRGGGGYYDRFRGRVMFPLKDFAGRAVGFSGRLLEKNAKEAKYINTPETSLYHKREMLYGLYEAKKAIREKDKVVVVEGELDVISSRRAKVREVVAVKGSALTDEQVQLIRRLTRNVVLALDADEAGQEAVKRAITTTEKHEMNLRVVVISEGKDPDDVVMKDPKEWREQVGKAVSVYRYYIDWAIGAYDVSTGSGVKKVSRVVAPVLARIENAVERAYYVKLMADKLQVSQRVVEEEVQKSILKRETGVSRELKKEKEEHKMGRRERLERYLLAVLLQIKQELKEMIDRLEIEYMGETYLRQLAEELKGLANKNETMNLEKIRRGLPKHMLGTVQELYTVDVELLNYDEEKLVRLYEKTKEVLKQMAVKEDLGRVSKRLSEMESDEEEYEELKVEYRKLKQLIEHDSPLD